MQTDWRCFFLRWMHHLCRWLQWWSALWLWPAQSPSCLASSSMSFSIMSSNSSSDMVLVAGWAVSASRMMRCAEGVFGAGCAGSLGSVEGTTEDWFESWLSGIVVLTRSTIPMVPFCRVSCAALRLGVCGTCVSGAFLGGKGRGEPVRVALETVAFFRFLFLCEGLFLSSLSDSEESVMVTAFTAGFWSIAFCPRRLGS